jgi:VWFA-related protein
VTRLITILLPAVAVLLLQDQGPPQVFRARVQGIAVTASVRDHGRPVTGLGASDFDVLDNGVSQQISSASVGSVPIDVSVVLDTSSSTGTGGLIQSLEGDVRALEGMLTDQDRLRLLTFSSTTRESVPFHTRQDVLTSVAIAPSGSTAFYQALIAAITKQPAPGRPHIVIALSDGDDNMSLLDATDLLSIAQRSESELQVVLRGKLHPMGKHVGWLAFQGPGNLEGLRAAAGASGGALSQEKENASAADVFRRVLDDFRTSYILTYTPTGAGTAGWHTLTVSVKSNPRYEIRARRGYFEE